jgi:5'-methylthioadenosine phosphorylase
MAETPRAQVGIFGGTGFYSLLTGEVREVWVETPYGPPSDKVAIGELGGKTVAFLPRHGRDHRFPPHRVNYRANLWAMKSLGVTDILGPCACGSLQTHIKPGEFVILDQLVDRTTGRQDTFYEGPHVTHVPAADPYCPILREHAVRICAELGIPHHPAGTIVVIQGPRFSTKAESRWFTAQGWEAIGMTQYPEAILTLEQEISYVGIGLITDYDAGLVAESPDTAPVTSHEVFEVFAANIEKVRALIARMVETLPDTSSSPNRRILSVSHLS